MSEGWTDNETINWGDVDTAPPAPIDPGLYRATILEAEASPTSKGKPCIVLTLEVNEALEGQEIEGRSKQLKWQRIVFSAGALFRAKQLAMAVGIEPPASTGYEAIGEWAEDLLGQDVSIRVKLGRPGNDGRRFPEVDRYCTAEEVDELLGGDDDDEPPKRSAKKAAKRPAAKGRRRRS
jgi:hypothetical protein